MTVYRPYHGNFVYSDADENDFSSDLEYIYLTPISCIVLRTILRQLLIQLDFRYKKWMEFL